MIDIETIYQQLLQGSSPLIGEDGRPNIKVAIISDNKNSLEICKWDSVYTLTNMLINQCNKTIKQKDKEIDLLMQKAGKKIDELRDRLQEQEKQYKETIEENENYKSWYGKMISPIQLINEIWGWGKIKPYRHLILDENKWELKISNSKEGAKAKKFWLSQFEEWELIERDGKRFVSAFTRNEAVEVYLSMKNKKVVNE